MKKIGLLCLIVGLITGAWSQTTYAKEKKEEPSKEPSNQLMIVNKTSNQLAFYEEGRLVYVFSVATGASTSATPEGDFHVSVKWQCPIYYKGKNGPCETGNPLGPRWIGLDVPGTAGYTYGIHGNASEWSIGTYASAGCVRMHNWQVTQLFDIVKEQTPVTIIRSDKSFDDIAKEKGYQVRKPKKEEEEITIIEETPVYYGAHEGLVLSNETLNNEKVKVIKRIDGWQQVETLTKNKKTGWIHTEKYVAGETTHNQMYVLLKKDRSLYAYPRKTTVMDTTVLPHIVRSTWQAGEWYYVQLTKNTYAWVHQADSQVVTKEAWAMQEQLKAQKQDWLVSWQQKSLTPNDYWGAAKVVVR